MIENIMRQDRTGNLLTQLQLQGVIDPPHVRYHRNAIKAFKTQDQDTERVKEKAVTLAKHEEPVLILGESGTGKELLARIIHGERHGKFVGVNVCAVTDTLFESELFGHVKGAFTGADRDREGLIKEAEGGTLFLDEIGDMPLLLQAKILRVIQERVYRRVGASSTTPFNCRIVAATHRNIPEMISAKEFRLDLYQRLNVFNLRVRPLRVRQGDIPLYVSPEFIEALNCMVPDPNIRIFSGNIRQLLNLERRWTVFGREEITVEDVA